HFRAAALHVRRHPRAPGGEVRVPRHQRAVLRRELVPAPSVGASHASHRSEIACERLAMTGLPSEAERQALALRVREHIICMAIDGGCFIGASLSCADLLVHLYTSVLSISPDRVSDEARDYLLLSKGHDVPALYGTL